MGGCSDKKAACSFPAAIPWAALRMCKASLPCTEPWSRCRAPSGGSQPCSASRRGTLLPSTDDRAEQITEMLIVNHVTEERGDENREHTQITTEQTALQEVLGECQQDTPSQYKIVELMHKREKSQAALQHQT